MDKPSRALQTLNLVTVVAVVLSLVLIFFVAPQEKVMGEVQRIFYWHVPSAWMSMWPLASPRSPALFTCSPAPPRLGPHQPVVGGGGPALYAAGHRLGFHLCPPAWNTWWTWDPRLTTYTIMALIYVPTSCCARGSKTPSAPPASRRSMACVGFVSVPITFFSIRWWRTIHPVVIGGSGSSAAEAASP